MVSESSGPEAGITIALPADNLISIKCRPIVSLDRLIGQIRKIFDEPAHDKWPLVGELAWAGAAWSGWTDLFCERQEQYATILGERAWMRDAVHRNDEARRQAMWERWEIHKEIKGYIPRDVPYPDLLEAEIVPTEAMFIAMDLEPSPAAFIEYLIKARRWWQIQTLDRTPHADDTVRELKAAQLVVTGAAIPPKVRLKALTALQLRACAQRLGLPPAVKALNLRAIEELPDDEDGRIETALKGIFDPQGYFAYLPPPGMSWQQLQDIRVHLRAQAVTLLDISYGEVDEPSLAILAGSVVA